MASSLFLWGAALAGAALLIRYALHRSRSAYIERYRFPPGLRERVRKNYPHLKDAQIERVFEALRDFFHLCRAGRGRRVAMPSRAVDVAWHEFILFTHGYQQFCRGAFGRYLHHSPDEALRGDATALEDSRLRTWRLACRRAGLDAEQALALPLLFRIDAELAIPDGQRHDPLTYRRWAAGVGASSSSSCSGGFACSATAGASAGCSDSGSGDAGGGCGGGCGGD